jgi:hypothetical protein
VASTGSASLTQVEARDVPPYVVASTGDAFPTQVEKTRCVKENWIPVITKK